MCLLLLVVVFFLSSNKNFKISHFNALHLAVKELLALYGKTDFVECSFFCYFVDFCGCFNLKAICISALKILKVTRIHNKCRFLPV